MSTNEKQTEEYIPARGHVLWMNFYPQAGHEQAGYRPALVISPATYNAKADLCIVCPITTKVKGYAFEVVIPENLGITWIHFDGQEETVKTLEGVILADHVKSLDLQARKAKFIGELPQDTVAHVLAKLETLLT